MKFSLRFVWYILRIVIVAVSAFAILIVAFFVAMDSANVFVIVSDGMKARAESMLLASPTASLDSYFTAKALQSAAAKPAGYEEFTISAIRYNLSVESLWCNPWQNTATVTVVESIPDMAYTANESETGGEAKEAAATEKPQPPRWQRARYKISCIRIADRWRIDSIQKVKDLEPEPTVSPEPSVYITASPLPTASPTATPTGAAAPTPSPAS